MLRLATPVTELSAIAEKNKAKLKRLGITNIRELLWHLPVRWEDFSNITSIKKCIAGERIVVVGRIVSIASRRAFRSKKYLTEAIIEDETGTIKAVWFNQPYLQKVLIEGKQYWFSGKVVDYYGLTLSNPMFERYDKSTATLHFKGLTPVYPLTGNVTQKQLRYLIHKALEKAPAVREHLPQQFLNTEGMVDLPTAVRQIHFPDSENILKKAIYRLKFEELWSISVKHKRVREALAKRHAYALSVRSAEENEFIRALPFSFTPGQGRAYEEIARDISLSHPMNRLLNGDVGSGKTVVAASAMFIAARNGCQSALMVPTEVLAHQHFETFAKLFARFDVTIALLTRSYQRCAVRGGEKKLSATELKQKLHSGVISIVIGTHTLIQRSVQFSNLVLAIVDEQHRFGVRQREALVARQTETFPHFLSLTATPIPRTYAQLLYGTLDISVLSGMPPGRKKTTTSIISEHKRAGIYEFIKKKLAKGRQFYVICPLIEESDVLGVEAVVTEEEKLRKIFLKQSIATLHGRMSGAEKENVLSRFAEGSIDMLISTSVVEVGIDVPNATLMMIESPERFGLAQLHQFRGRIGRGEHTSYCFLMAGENAEENKRLKALENIDDGFKLAEVDLKTRGPGELYGVKQSGFLQLKIARLSDIGMIKKVQSVV